MNCLAGTKYARRAVLAAAAALPLLLQANFAHAVETIRFAVTDIAGKISAEDPYIKGVRAGRFKPGTIRLVFDLKAKVKPEAFAASYAADRFKSLRAA